MRLNYDFILLGDQTPGCCQKYFSHVDFAVAGDQKPLIQHTSFEFLRACNLFVELYLYQTKNSVIIKILFIDLRTACCISQSAMISAGRWMIFISRSLIRANMSLGFSTSGLTPNRFAQLIYSEAGERLEILDVETIDILLHWH